jgi:hypothetical protein
MGLIGAVVKTACCNSWSKFPECWLAYMWCSVSAESLNFILFNLTHGWLYMHALLLHVSIQQESIVRC